MAVVIETTIGDITVDLFTEERPIACLNFLKLCKLKYYNFNLFHTIEQGFIAQTGDPTGKGDGGSSVWGLVEGSHKRFFEAESIPKIYHSSAGLISLVSAGKNLAGSQFFFTLGANLISLDGVHCVIGEVVEGHDTLRKLNDAIVDESFRPFQDIRITHTVVLEDAFPDPRGFQMPNRSPSPSIERLQNGRIAADEEIDDTDGKTMEEIQEMLAEREAKARATILEIVGDIPDAEVAPPENVLFVCKLNPVTTDDDLEIIFSRFGKVKSCEVIRDKKTGDSLQYAFVEFEEQKSCEAAYFKMDNVLIDDRRIHVDFSQSVAKVKWRGKGRGVEGSQGRLDFNNLKEDKTKVRSRHDKNKYSLQRRDSMTSEERRKEREKRHREQEKRHREEERHRKPRSRSRSRNEFRVSKRHYDSERLYEQRYRNERHHGKYEMKEESFERERYEKKRYARSVSKERRRSGSVEARSPLLKKSSERRQLSNKRFREDNSKQKHKSMDKSGKEKNKKKHKHNHSDTSDDASSTSASSDRQTSSNDSDSDSHSNLSKEHKRKAKSSKSKKKKSKKQKKKRSKK